MPPFFLARSANNNSASLLEKAPAGEEKDKLNSKKGAFYYRVDSNKYSEGFKAFLNFVPSQNANK